VLETASVSPSQEVCRLHFESRHNFFLHLIIIYSIQEFGEKPKFHPQSQWNPETRFLPYVAREKLQRGTHPFRFVIVR
jgi:hypothetical protein